MPADGKDHIEDTGGADQECGQVRGRSSVRKETHEDERTEDNDQDLINKPYPGVKAESFEVFPQVG